MKQEIVKLTQEALTRFGLTWTHVEIGRVEITQLDSHSLTAHPHFMESPGGNAIVDPFIGVLPQEGPRGVFTAQLAPARDLRKFVAVAHGKLPARGEIHGIDTLPACLTLAQAALGGAPTLDQLSVRSHIIRAPICTDLDLVAGLPEGIKEYRKNRQEKPALECRVVSNNQGDNSEVVVLGYATKTPNSQAVSGIARPRSAER